MEMQSGESGLKRTILKAGLLGFAVGLSMVLAACGSDNRADESVVPELESEPAERAAEQPARQPRDTRPTESVERDTRQLLPRTTGQLEEDGHGMTMVVDGTSAEAFHQSLEWIAADSSHEQYQLLEHALQYLRMYTQEARQGNEALYLSLDGLTGEDIIERAREVRQRRSAR